MKKLLVSSFLAALLSSTAFAGDVSAYESAGFKDVNSVKSGLKSSGFSVVGEYDAMGNPNYHVIAYTNADMKAAAAKEDLGFAAVQKVLVSKKDKELVFTNPEYFLHAFLEDEYNEANAKKINSALKAAFGALKGSNDALDDDIAGYHFMMGMPYYEDMIEVAKGKDLLQKLEKNAGDNIVFKVNLKNGVLVGMQCPKKRNPTFRLSKVRSMQHFYHIWFL